MIKTLVLDWLLAGAPFAEGARLFSDTAGAKNAFNIILQKKTKASAWALKIVLCRRAGISKKDVFKTIFPATAPVQKPKPIAEIKREPAPVETPKLREEWPFLSDPACPAEFKILAANKITAYHAYCAAHASLFEAIQGTQFTAVKTCVENYIENRRILEEFKHYKEHQTILGKHPVFKSMLTMAELRRLSVMGLVKKKEKLEHNIWRLQAEIKKGDKKHLQVEREARMQEKKSELAEVERLLKEHE